MKRTFIAAAVAALGFATAALAAPGDKISERKLRSAVSNW